MIIWEAHIAAAATGGRINTNWQGSQISIDTRTIEPGEIFLALKGNNVDGHDYIDDAIARGASAVIVDRDIHNEDIPYLRVNDTYKAIADLASFKRRNSKAKVIAVTGSVGKTTTKEMLGTVFSTIGKTFASRGNYNNKLGLSINLASIPDNTEYAIFELGMNAAGELTDLSQSLKPDVAIITTIAPAHLEFFTSVAAIAEAKAEIFNGTKSGGIAIIGIDHQYTDILYKLAIQKNLAIVTCGEKGDVTFNQLVDNQINIKWINDTISFILPTNNRAVIYNSLFVCALLWQLVPDQITMAIKALQNFMPALGRGREINTILNGKKITVIDDSYNASPVAVKQALSNLGKYHKRKIAVLGDMLELGPNAEDYHRQLRADIVVNKVDLLITIGKLTYELSKAVKHNVVAYHASSITEIFGFIQNKAKNDDVILIKGSKTMQLYNLVKQLLEN